MQSAPASMSGSEDSSGSSSGEEESSASGSEETSSSGESTSSSSGMSSGSRGQSPSSSIGSDSSGGSSDSSSSEEESSLGLQEPNGAADMDWAAGVGLAAVQGRAEAGQYAVAQASESAVGAVFFNSTQGAGASRDASSPSSSSSDSDSDSGDSDSGRSSSEQSGSGSSAEESSGEGASGSEQEQSRAGSAQHPPAKRQRTQKANRRKRKHRRNDEEEDEGEGWVGVERAKPRRGRPRDSWAASVLLPFTLGGRWLSLGTGFKSAEGAAIAADRAAIAVWGRRLAEERDMLNFPPNTYGLGEQQLFGPELGDFLACLRVFHSAFVPPPGWQPVPARKQWRRQQQQPASQNQYPPPPPQGQQQEQQQQQEEEVVAVAEEGEQVAAEQAQAEGEGEGEGEFAEHDQADDQGQAPASPLLGFKGLEPCGRCPACRQPWLGQGCRRIVALKSMGRKSTWEKHAAAGSDPQAAAEAQRQAELLDQRTLVRRVLSGRHKRRRGRPPKGLKAAQAAAAASGRSLEDLVAEASELHGIGADESSDESSDDSSESGEEEEERGRRGRGLAVGAPPSLARHFKLRRAKRKLREGEQQQELQLEGLSGRPVGKGSRGRTQQQQQQQQKGSPPPQLLPPPPARRLVWIEPPHRLPDSERRGLRKTERKQGRAAQASQELREALERELGARDRDRDRGTAAPVGSLALAEGVGSEGGTSAAAAAAAGGPGSGDGGIGRGGGALPRLPLADSLRPQPHPQLVRQIARERLRGGSLFEIQRGSLESGARPCAQCGGMHFAGATAALGATACPVWQAANTVLAPEPTNECPGCADLEVPGCRKCLPEGRRRRQLVVGPGAAQEAVTAVMPLAPMRVRAPWLECLPPHTLDLMTAAQGVADAAAADLALPQTSGRFTPKSLLACALLAEAAMEAQLQQRRQSQRQQQPGQREQQQQQQDLEQDREQDREQQQQQPVLLGGQEQPANGAADAAPNDNDGGTLNRL